MTNCSKKHLVLQELFPHQKVVFLDGGLATELEARGMSLNDPLWSAKCLLENPNLIRDVHCDYYRAGSQIVITSTYQASYEGLMNRGLGRQEAEQLFMNAVNLAKQARDECANGTDRPLLVAASVGSYGAFCADGSEYSGNYSLTDEELRQWHAPRLQTLAASGADLLAVETIPVLREAKAIVAAMPDNSPPAWIAFSCASDDKTCGGDLFYECVKWAAGEAKVAAVGVNCTPPRFIEPLLRIAIQHTQKPIVIYPNAGEDYDPITKEWVTGTATGDAQMCTYAKQWKRLLVDRESMLLLGGCCRTTPRTIRSLINDKQSE